MTTSGVVAYVPDLMDRSRVAAVAPGTTFVASPDDLVEAAAGAGLVVVDLGRPGVLEVLPRLAPPVVGFAAHVDTDTFDAARGAGCRQVLPRSRFFRELPALLG